MSADAVLRQRVLPIAEFASEKRSGRTLTASECEAKYGPTYAPIPVPLALGETEEQYEAAFRANAETRTGRPYSEVQSEWDVEKERRQRCFFADHRLKEFHAKHEPLESFVDDLAMPPRRGQKRENPQAAKKSTRKDAERKSRKDAWQRREDMDIYVKRYVDLDEHERNVRAGLFHRIKEMTADEKQREFGSQIVPIFVPLARGEMKEKYEERFIKWLWNKHRRTLDELVAHPNLTQERHYRMLFAQANTFDQARFVPPVSDSKRGREKDELVQREESPRKKPKEQSTKEDERPPVETKVQSSRKEICSGQGTISSIIACGCRQCLVSGMRRLATTITEVDTKIREQSKSSNDQAAHIVELLSDTESAGHSDRLMPQASGQEDAIQVQLMSAYDTINEQIVMNEKVLENSAIRLASTPVHDIKETTQIQDEDQEMRELVRDEMPSRSAALAVLIVYMWREKISELKEMASDPNATDVIYVQRATHHKCAMLAGEIATKRRVIMDLKAQLQAVAGDTVSEKTEKLRVKSILEALRLDATKELTQLESQQKQQFANLVYFDEHIRQLIQALLVQL